MYGYTATNISTGSKTVTAAGTAEALSSTSIRILGIIITAKNTNTGQIYYGGASVSSSRGAILFPGQSSPLLPIDNLAKVYIDVTTNGDGVQFTYFW